MKESIDEFLFTLSELGIKLWAENDILRCNAPKELLTDSLREQLTERKAEILTFLNKFSSQESDRYQSLKAIAPDKENRYQPFPLNEMQQAYWIGRMDSFDMGNVSIHAYREMDVVDLDIERLNRAWQQLINRHDMLRAIVLPDGQQQILEQVPPYEIQVLELRGQDPEAVASQLEATRDRLSHQILPLEQWPQFEILASRLDEKHTRLHMSNDGWCIDGRSFQLLFRELEKIYNAPDEPLPPLELSFRDYVLATLALEKLPIYQKSLDYWLSRISTLPPSPELPLAQNPSALKKTRFVSLKYKLETQALQRLMSRATKADLTLASTLLAVYTGVMRLWSKSPRFTINVPRFNRLPLHPQVNDILGELASFTLLEVDHSGNEPFEVRAGRIQAQLWQDLEHEYVSGVRLLRELAKVRGKALGATMPVVFTGMPQVDSNKEIGDISLGEVVCSLYQTPQVWIDHIYLVEADGSLTYTWHVVEDLFPEGMVNDMFDAACRLLQRLANEEDGWQETTQALIPSAQLEQRAAINDTAAEVSDALIHSLFAAQVRQRPQQAAIVTSTRTLTYQELYELSNQVAHRLRQLGVRPNQLIATVMEKGWEQIVAVMGILASGAAYVPIDPALPQERLFYLLENSEVQIVLTQSWLKEKLTWLSGVQLLCLDNEDLAHESNQPLQPVQKPDDLAYVLYTSGSTGLPKGVMIAHRGVVNAIVQTNQRFNIGFNDRVLALTALHHDMSVYDIFGILAAGGTIVMPDASATRDPVHWTELMLQENITIWNSVPAMMEMLLEYVDGRSELLASSLRWAFLGGDWISVTLPQRLKELGSSFKVVSVGGPTETTLWNIWYLVEEVDPTWKSIPYGKPIANTKYYVLNEALEDRPLWVPGEIYCSGVGVAKGYWRNEEKTRANFIIHPRTGERIYRTGDLGRYLPDGNIEFLGRVDFQIKLRGQRIETGEIEAALTQHPNVKASVVTVVGTQPNQQRLVAYVVPNQHSPEKKLAEAYEPRQLEGVLVDSVERIEFKLQQLGLRQLQPTQLSIELPKPEFDEVLTQDYLQRQSYRQFLDKPVPLKQLGQFLSCLLQIKLDASPLPKYRYPSGGGLYPVQTYLYVKPNRVEGLEAGFYYYHPADHRLLLLSAACKIKGSIYAERNQPIFAQSAFSLFLIGQMSAITPMYGELARDLCLLEAGYIGQLLMTSAPEHEIGLCPIGSLEFEELRDSLTLESSQILLHSFVGGKIDPAWTKQWLEPEPTTSQNQKSESIADELRSFLQQKLPDYMVPSAYIFLDALPLTPNGKVDRLALPAPESLHPELKSADVMPQTELEKLISAVWQEVLQIEKIGIHANFFELGGNSILMIKTQVKLQEILSREMSIVEMFKSPTIYSLVKYLSQNPSTEASNRVGHDRADSRSARQTLRNQQKQSRQKHRLTNN